MAERLRALLREIGPGGVRGGAAILLVALAVLVALFALLVVAIWYVLSYEEEAAQQETEGEGITVVAEGRPEDYPLIFGPGPSPGFTEARTADGRRLGIPWLSGVELASNLMYLPGFDFRCLGSSPAGEGLYKRTCSSSADDDPATYEVTIVEEDATTVVWVRATAQDASEDDAAAFLASVGRLTVGAGPFDPEAWVRRGISSGGQVFADGVEVRLYGTQQARTLEIVATGSPLEEPPSEAASPKADQGDGKADAQGKAKDKADSKNGQGK